MACWRHFDHTLTFFAWWWRFILKCFDWINFFCGGRHAGDSWLIVSRALHTNAILRNVCRIALQKPRSTTKANARFFQLCCQSICVCDIEKFSKMYKVDYRNRVVVCVCVCACCWYDPVYRDMRVFQWTQTYGPRGQPTYKTCFYILILLVARQFILLLICYCLRCRQPAPCVYACLCVCHNMCYFTLLPSGEWLRCSHLFVYKCVMISRTDKSIYCVCVCCSSSYVCISICRYIYILYK